jgi:hypothetical protein
MAFCSNHFREEVELRTIMKELNSIEIEAVSGGHWLKHAWRFISLFFLHPSHTSKDESEK